MIACHQSHIKFFTRTFILLVVLFLSACNNSSSSRIDRQSKTSPPNIIIILTDDLGYGDLGCYGSKIHRTPNIDFLAQEGTLFTDFYMSSPFCSPSRAALLSGSYPQRIGMDTDNEGKCVLFPVAKKGLNPDNINLANHLKKNGYSSACVGKWHLGDQTDFMPLKQGFDYFYGVPYSNDTNPTFGDRPVFSRAFPEIPLLENEVVLQAPINQTRLTKNYTTKAIQFITQNKDNPFFLYLAHSMPHKPPHSSFDFKGKSKNGAYGDAVEEIDWSTGEIMETLKRLKLDNTVVIFTSDNGASRLVEDGKGSNLPLRGWKGTTWEGGVRVPCIMWWSGKIPKGVQSSQLITAMDLFPTLCSIAGNPLPGDYNIDGENVWQFITTNKKTNERPFFYYLREQLQAVRYGEWKLHLPLDMEYVGCWNMRETSRELSLFNLNEDIGETRNVATLHPDIVERLLKVAQEARSELGDVRQKGTNFRKAGYIENPVPIQKNHTD